MNEEVHSVIRDSSISFGTALGGISLSFLHTLNELSLEDWHHIIGIFVLLLSTAFTFWRWYTCAANNDREFLRPWKKKIK